MIGGQIAVHIINAAARLFCIFGKQMAATRDLGPKIRDLATAAGLKKGIVSFDDRPAGHGWSAVITCEGAVLELDLSRDGFVATIVKPEEKNMIIDEPETWGMFYPEEKKIDFYLRVFQAHLRGELKDRIYAPKREPNSERSDSP